MKRLFGFLGSVVGGYVGWYIGAPIGIMTAFMLSMVGTGFGIWGGWRIAERYL